MKHLDFPEVFLGSVSDVMGRRPLVRAVGVATTMPLLAVLLYLTTGAGDHWWPLGLPRSEKWTKCPVRLCSTQSFLDVRPGNFPSDEMR